MDEEQSGRYRILMSVEPAVVLRRPKTFKDHWYEIRFENIEHDKMRVAKGLAITVTLLTMPDIRTAESRARGLVNQLLSLFSFLTITSLPELLIHRVYEVTPGRTRGDFLQYYYAVPFDTISVRMVNDSDFRNATDRLAKLSEDAKDSLFRAMHWYRLALQSTDALERFTLLWIGLESINSLLREHYGLKVEYSHCSNCGRKASPILNGVRKLWRDTIAEVDWKRVRNQRTGTLHGFGVLKDIAPESKVMIPLLERVLREGLSMLLGVSSRTEISPINLGAAHPAYYSSEAIVEGPDLQNLDSEIVPGFDIELKTSDPTFHSQHHQFNAVQVIDKRFSFVQFEHRFHAGLQVGQRIGITPPSEDEPSPK